MTAFMQAIQTGVESVAGYVYTAGEAVVVGTGNVLSVGGTALVAVGKAIFLGTGISG